MIINTKGLDYSRFYKILNISRSGEQILVNAFLARFYDLFDSFRAAIDNNAPENMKTESISSEAAKLKDFIYEAGGSRAARLLAEYEKNAAIGDFVSCRSMETYLIEEIEAFKEAVVSMFS